MRILKLLPVIIAVLCLSNCTKDTVKESIARNLELAGNQNISADIRIRAVDSAWMTVRSKQKHQIEETDLIRIIKSYYSLNAIDSVLPATTVLAQIASKNKDTARLGIVNHFLGRYYSKKGVLDSSYFYHRRAEVFYSKARLKQNSGVNYLDIAALQLRISDHTNCEESLKRAMKFFGPDEHGLAGQYFANRLYSEIFAALEYYDDALEYQRAATKILVTIDPDFKRRHFATDAYATALLYQKKGDCRTALHHFKNAERNLAAPEKVLRTKISISKANCAIKMADFPTAKSELAKISKNLRLVDPGTKAAYYLSLSKLYKIYGGTANSILALRRADSIATVSNLPRIKLLAIDNLISAKSTDSYALAGRYIEIVDSLDKAERIIQNSFARIEFRNDQLVVQTEMAWQHVWLILTIMGLFIIIVIILYKIRVHWLKRRELLLKYQRQISNESVYRLMARKKAKIRKVRKREKVRIAAEIKNKTVVRLGQVREKLLEIEHAQSDEEIDECLKYIDEIQKVEFNIRDVAHDLNREIFSENIEFNVVLESLVRKYEAKSNAAFFLEIQPEINWDLTVAVVKINTYQIVEDLIRNSVRGKAANIFITIVTQESNLKLIVIDDGDGKDFLKLDGGTAARNVLARITSLSGSIDNKPRKGKGATIIVNLPHHKHLQTNGDQD